MPAVIEVREPLNEGFRLVVRDDGSGFMEGTQVYELPGGGSRRKNWMMDLTAEELMDLKAFFDELDFLDEEDLGPL